MAEEMRFENVASAKIDSLLQKLGEIGFTATPLASENGPQKWNIEGRGVVAEVNYDAAAQAMDVSILKRPFIIPAAAIFNRIQGALDA